MPHANPHACQVVCASIFFHTWLLAVSSRRERATMPVVPYAFRCLPTESSLHGATNSVSCHHRIAVLSPRSAYLDGRYTELNYEHRSTFRDAQGCIHICLENGLKLNPLNCYLAAVNVLLCSRIFDYKCVQFHPRQYEAFKSIETPTTVCALLELVHGANGMQTAIPRFFGAHEASAQPFGVSVLNAQDPPVI